MLRRWDEVRSSETGTQAQLEPGTPVDNITCRIHRPDASDPSVYEANGTSLSETVSLMLSACF